MELSIKRTPRKHLSAAVMRIMRTSPFYTTILMKHQMVPDENVNGMEIDGAEIRYNAEAIMTLSVPELAECLKHLAMHVAHRHHIRQEEIRPIMEPACKAAGVRFEEAFDQGADLSINSLLRKNNEVIWQSEKMADAPIPGQGKFTDFDDGACAEDYTKQVIKLYEEQEQEEQPGENPPPCNGGQGGEGEGGGNGGGGNDEGDGDGENDQDQEEQDQDDQQDNDNEDNEQEDGGGNSPNQSPPPAPQPMNFGMVKPSKKEHHEAEQEADEMIAAASMAAKAAGEDTGTVKGIIAENEKPVKVNWRAEVEQFMQQACRGRKNYRHINRRLFGGGVIFPTNKDRSPKKVVIFVDVSGSMNDEAVGAVYNHIETIIQAKEHMTILLAPFDADVFRDSVAEFNRDNCPISTEARSRIGWGGTKFMPTTEYLKEVEDVSAAIMLTDLLPCDTEEFNKYKPDIPWIILSVLEFQFKDSYSDYACRPDWAKIIEIEP